MHKVDALTRRRFLIASGVVGASGLVAGVTAYSLKDVLQTASDADPSAGILVVVTLYGGNDGLNTLVPYADRSYHDARPELAYQADQVLRLDDRLGLSPALKGLHGLYGQGKMAIVRGVGYPKPDRSHFRSMDIWHTAEPQRPGNTGWLGRWLDTAGGDPRLAVSFEPALPPLLAGATCAGASVPVSGKALPKPIRPETLRAFGKAEKDEPALQARAAECFTELLAVQAMIKEVTATEREQENQATGTGGQSALDAQLDVVAQCVKGGAATRVYSVSLGGFDNHADERAPHEAQLKHVDSAVSSFMDAVKDRQVTVMIYSEFGRRVRANASDGTDHGTASTMFLLGAGVKGGMFGEQPSLTDLDSGDLKFTTDFRDVYASVAENVLGADPQQLLSGWHGQLRGLFA